MLARGTRHREPSGKSDAPVAPDAEVPDVEVPEVKNQPFAPNSFDAEEHLPPHLHEQPTVADTVDAVLEVVIDPICQGAVTVAEQIAQAAEIAEEHLPANVLSGQPTMQHAFDVVKQNVIDPIRQGAVAIAEQVAQVVEPSASSPPGSRAGSPQPKRSSAALPVPGNAERARSRSPCPSHNGSCPCEQPGSPKRSHRDGC